VWNIATREERVFNFCVVYDYDPDGQPLEKGEGWISTWKEIPSQDIGLTPSGYPNSWAYATIIARLVSRESFRHSELSHRRTRRGKGRRDPDGA
jgi:hypothetical protein